MSDPSLPNDHPAPPLPSNLTDLISALSAIHDPRTPNDIRQRASDYLESAKSSPHTLAHGFALATDTAREPVVRHFGLGLMAHYLKYQFTPSVADGVLGIGAPEAALLRDYAVQLARVALRPEDPPFVRNKVVQVWCDVVKRAWGPGMWMDMDGVLVELWEGRGLGHREFVMAVLETLSDDIFNQEDYLAALRQQDLASGFTRIVVPMRVLEAISAAVASRAAADVFVGLRAGRVGWYERLHEFLKECLDSGMGGGDEVVHGCVVRALIALKSISTWVHPRAFRSDSGQLAVREVCCALVMGDTPIRLAAIDTLCVIIGRNLDDEDAQAILSFMYSQDTIQLIDQALNWSNVQATEIDDSKYNFLKKLSTLMSCLGNFADSKPDILVKSGNLPAFFNLYIAFCKHPSLVVSTPLLQLWLKLFRSRTPEYSGITDESMGPLLSLCNERCFRFDALKEDDQHPTLLFLNEDFDNTPQRDSLLSQNRAACLNIVEVITRKVPVDATNFLLNEATQYIEKLTLAGGYPMDGQSWVRNSYVTLEADARLTIVEACVRGCMKWSDQSEQGIELRKIFAQWCQEILKRDVKDPDFLRKLYSQVSSITTRLLSQHSEVAFTVLEHCMNLRNMVGPGNDMYLEVGKDLIETGAYVAQRLGATFADQFLGVYDQLQAKVNEVINQEKRTDLGPPYTAFLCVIVHRSSNATQEQKIQRLLPMMMRVKEEWLNENIKAALQSQEAFFNFMGWSMLPEFLRSNNFSMDVDWSTTMLNESGRELQRRLVERMDLLPIRWTKAMLHATTDRLEEGSEAWALTCIMWVELFQFILETILNAMSNSLIFYDVEKWPNLTPDQKPVVKRVLSDRFWQSGISNESRANFIDKIQNSKHTFDGFGSSVRRTARHVRTGCCDIILLFSKLGKDFYGIPNLSVALSLAMFDGAGCLNSHPFMGLLQFSNQIIRNCPPSLRKVFLPALLEKLFVETERKIATEWDAANQRVSQTNVDDNLDDEMKTLSTLRPLTYYTCNDLLAPMLDPNRPDITPPSSRSAAPDSTPPSPPSSKLPQSIFNLITHTPSILEPCLLLFRTLLLSARDSQSIHVLLLTLRELVPFFRDPGPVHDFVCEEILKAAIMALHEPSLVDQQRDLAGLVVVIVGLDAPPSPPGHAGGETGTVVPGSSAEAGSGMVGHGNGLSGIAGDISPEVDIPRRVLLSLPNLVEARVVDVLRRIRANCVVHQHAYDSHHRKDGDTANGNLGTPASTSVFLPGAEKQGRALVLELLEGIRGVSLSELGRVTKRGGGAGKRLRSEGGRGRGAAELEGVGGTVLGKALG